MSDRERKIPVSGGELEENFDDISGAYATKFSDMSESYNDYITLCDETFRTRFRRDKDRILYSKSFRRLQHKTQVISSDAGDHQRTRLLHTLEVQQLAGSISDALRANTDLSEAIALGHDLGHTPFGHAGERTLDKLLQMEDCGGFSHAIQSVRILSEIEKHPNQASGLRINQEVLAGILKHDADIFGKGYSDQQYMQLDLTHYDPERVGGIESQIVYWSDKLAYLSHDWEDFIRYCYNGIKKHSDNPTINNRLEELCELWNSILGIKTCNIANLNKIETRDIIRIFTSDLISNTKKYLLDQDFKTSKDLIEHSNGKYCENIKLADKEKDNDKISTIRKNAYQDSLVVNLTDDFRNKFRSARAFLNEYYIGDPSIVKTDMQGEHIIKTLYQYFTSEPKALEWDQRIKTLGKASDEKFVKRVIADHIAGMTDRYAISVYNQIMGIRSV